MSFIFSTFPFFIHILNQRNSQPLKSSWHLHMTTTRDLDQRINQWTVSEFNSYTSAYLLHIDSLSAARAQLSASQQDNSIWYFDHLW